MKSNILLLITAMIWGFAFVAQRSGMEYLGPFTFNAIRFALGGVSLIPILLINQKRKFENTKFLPFLSDKVLLKGGIVAGIIIFFGASFQQGGIVYTTAGKAGFITGLYIILVPILGLMFKQKTSSGTWIGALVAVVGLYLLSVKSDFSIGLGDLLVLASAFFWAAHVLWIGRISPKTDPIQLAFLQFMLCSILSLITALVYEVSTLQNIIDATVPILYAGFVSVGIAYTLQVVAQRDAHPSHAAIIMSLESVFAVIGGWIVLNESIAMRGLIGCALMLAGMIISQISLTIKFSDLKSLIKPTG
jgi:drug/metabolite transporter (DMT)-like permease